jgi:hypothetical protein
MLKKHVKGIWLSLVCLTLLIPQQGNAFEKMTFGENQELTIWGWLRNNTGVFLQKLPYQQNNDNLATERTWLRTYADWKMSDQFRFYTAIQFAYEPWYKSEDGSGSKKGGEEYSEYKNLNDVFREAYFQWSPNKKNDLKIGRQIAIWGESLTERVGDVIHPDDSRFALAFTNLEDSRIPQWMIRSIHDIDPLSSSFEWIVNPLLVDDQYRVSRLAQSAQPILNEAGQRFALNPEDRFQPPNSVGNPILFPIAAGVASPPFSRGWTQLPSFIPGPMAGKWVPTEVPTVREVYPDNTINDTRFGFRTNTNLGNTLFGVMYWHTHNYDPLVKRGNLTGRMVQTGPDSSVPERQYNLVHPAMDIIGAHMNEQLPWPGVIRAEAIYSPNKPFNTFDVNVTDAIVTRDYFKYMVAYDLSNFFYFDWHKTAPFDVTLEHVGEYIPNADNLQYLIYATKQPSYVPRFNGRISTNWFYNRISTEIVVSYWPWANSGLVMPAIKWTPGWWNQKFSAELKYISVYGDNNYEGMGILRGKEMIVLTTQFNF